MNHGRSFRQKGGMMPKREKTKHKGIYKIGDDYYVGFRDGTMKTSRNGIPYYVKREKKIGPRLADART